MRVLPVLRALCAISPPCCLTQQPSAAVGLLAAFASFKPITTHSQASMHSLSSSSHTMLQQPQHRSSMHSKTATGSAAANRTCLLIVLPRQPTSLVKQQQTQRVPPVVVWRAAAAAATPAGGGQQDNPQQLSRPRSAAVEDMYEHALELCRQERYDEARAAFEALVSTHPHFCRGWVSYGQMERRMARISEPLRLAAARQILQRGLSTNPESGCLAQAWGLMELQKSNWWAAVKMLERAVALDPCLSPVLRWKPVTAARNTISGSSRYRPVRSRATVACASQGTGAAGASGASAAAAGSSAGPTAAASGSTGSSGGSAGVGSSSQGALSSM